MKNLILIVALAFSAAAASQTPTPKYLACTGSGSAQVCTAPGTIAAGSSPWADIRTYGATADGSTPIDTALSSAIASQCSSSGTSGASCQVLLPCGGSGCVLQNGNIASTNTGKVMQIKIQGTLTPKSTIVFPDNTTVVGDCGSSPGSFQNRGCTAAINAGALPYGTLGTATTSANTLVTFTPTFGQGSIANVPPGSAITVGGTTSCAASVTRSTASSNNVTASCAAYTRIPPLTNVTVSACSDSSLNGTFELLGADYPAQTLSWTQSGGATSATGCVITGLNEDSYETAQVLCSNGVSISGGSYSCAAGQVAAIFAHTHNASDQWGAVGAMFTPGTDIHHELDNILITYGHGMQFWAPNIADLTLIGDSFEAVSSWPAGAAELDDTWWGSIKTSSFGVGFGSYPYGLRCSQTAAAFAQNGIGCGFMSLSDSTVSGGVKVDSNDTAESGPACCWQTPAMHDVVLEQPGLGGVVIDNRYLGGAQAADMLLDNAILQDDLAGNPTTLIAYTDSEFTPGGTAVVKAADDLVTGQMVNKYFNGTLEVSGITGNMNLTYGRGVPPGEYHRNGSVVAEIPQIGANLGPSAIPYATENVTTNPSSWSCTSCTVNLVQSPDGSTDAGEIQGTGNATVWSQSMTTATGDAFLVGAWVRSGTNQPNPPSGFWGFNKPYSLLTNGTDTFTGYNYAGSVTPASFAPDFSNWSWHPQVMLATVTAGDSSSHTISFNLYGGGAGIGNQFFMPFVIYVPASAGVALNELERWREDLLHGAVPPNYSGPGIPATNLPIATNGYYLLNPSGGAPLALASKNLADFSSTAPTNGQVPIWNSASGKYVPTTPAGGGSSAQIKATLPSALITTTGNLISYTTTAAGLYRMCGYADVTVAASGYMEFNYTYTSDGNLFPGVYFPNQGATSTTQWANTGGCGVFYADASTTIYLTINFPAGATVRVSGTLEQLE